MGMDKGRTSLTRHDKMLVPTSPTSSVHANYPSGEKYPTDTSPTTTTSSTSTTYSMITIKEQAHDDRFCD